MLWFPLLPWFFFSLGLLFASHFSDLSGAEPSKLILAFVAFALGSLYSRYRAPFAERVFFILGFSALGGHLLAEAVPVSSPAHSLLVKDSIGVLLALAFFLMAFILRVKGERLFPEGGVLPGGEILFRSLAAEVEATQRGVHVIYALTPAYPNEIEGLLRRGEEAFQASGGYIFFVPGGTPNSLEEFLDRLRRAVPLERYAAVLWRGEPLLPLIEKLREVVLP